jgi:hypothetical protein
MGTKLHVIVSMQVLDLAVKYAEYASIARYGAWARVTLPRATPDEGGSRSLLQENSVPLIVPESGTHFPPSPERGFPAAGEFMGDFPESNRIAFSSLLRSVEWYRPIRLKDEENGSRHTDFNGSPVELALQPRSIYSWLGSDMPADCGGVFPCAGETGH